ncbi:uncharacterized protein Dwil_GK16304 [Drosophila willistoni]|uniref:Uncharacterized protein n=1 Tax=Drosophila willistoni TaxID=7260 RepID=A0A0Q9WRG8_DROWI|nr:uncharacterized protein LOC6644587 [Drosophila willistoni]KRF98831.1 uncharacterized protein Dwil_GK16304 [Drosophila willistoni]
MDAEAKAIDSIKQIVRRSLGSEALAGRNHDNDANTTVDSNDRSCDNVSDVDLHNVTAQLEQTLKPGHSDTKSLFNVNIEEFTSDLPSLSDELAIYEDRVKKEQLKWIDFVVNTSRNGRTEKVPEGTIQLNNEHLLYLNSGPNLQNFIRSSLLFMNEANLFNIKTANMEIIRDNLLQHCQGVLNNRKSQATAINLSGQHG